MTAWELARLAQARGMPALQFLYDHTRLAGTRLRMGGAPGWRHLPACDLYADTSGCTAHASRPLACRLYPLGRVASAGSERYFFEGRDFPCHAGCPEVDRLPSLTVADYLAGQDLDGCRIAQDAAQELLADLAEAALAILQERLQGTTAAELRRWMAAALALGVAGRAQASSAAEQSAWSAPDVDVALLESPRQWTEAQARGLTAWLASLRDPAAQALAAWRTALHLAHALGADAQELGRIWLATTAR